MRAAWVSLVALVALGGCHIATLPDPNDTHGINPNPEMLQQKIAAAHAVLDIRVARGELSEKDKQQRLDSLFADMTKRIDVEQVSDRAAYRYADILRQAGKWKDAEKLYQRAVEVAHTPDREVNDSLQLARVKAHLGKVDEAIALVKTTFKARPTDKVPILMSTLYEIVPEAKGKGKDTELAQLLELCVEQHMLAEIDPELDTGKAFVAAMPKHIQNAWGEIARLYKSAGNDDDMKRAINRQIDQSGKLGRY